MSRRIAIVLLLFVLGTACGSDASGPELDDPRQVFESVWRDFDRNYAFFVHGGIDWDALGATYRDSIGPITAPAEAARVIGAMIGRLNDYHADLTTPFGVFGPPPIPHAHHFSPDLMRRSYLDGQPAATPSGRIRYAPLGGSVGYVHIGSFEGEGWGSDIEHALGAMPDVDALIVDIRDNLGGNEQNGRDVAVRFYDATRVYRTTRFRNGPAHGDFGAPESTSLSPGGARRFTGPVVLLTNRFNGSAAEDFILMMRVLPNVTVVGDTTLGLGSNPLVRELGDGWSYRIPRSMQSTPEGFVYQWRGLPPDVFVPWVAADTAAGRDPFMEEALRQLAAR